MRNLAFFFYSLIATTLAGVCVVVALVAGFTTMIPLLAAAGLGALLAIPLTVLVARALTDRDLRR